MQNPRDCNQCTRVLKEWDEAAKELQKFDSTGPIDEASGFPVIDEAYGKAIEREEAAEKAHDEHMAEHERTGWK